MCAINQIIDAPKCEGTPAKNVPDIGKCCDSHYARWYIHKDVKAHVPIKRTRSMGSRKDRPTTCTGHIGKDKCGKKVLAMGLCNRHYAAKYSQNDPDYKLTPRKKSWWGPLPDKDKALYYLDPANDYVIETDNGEPTSCLIWQGNKTKEGYGQVVIAGKTHRIHRFVYFALNPESEDGVVHHKCHHRDCTNPEHLIVEKNISDNAYEGFTLARALKQIEELLKQIEELEKKIKEI
jgi:hypothetical protein